MFLNQHNRCDACRKRKVCCMREAGYTDCSLCRLRKTTCSFELKPNIRSRRTTVIKASEELESVHANNVSEIVQDTNLTATPIFAVERWDKEWISQYVGSSGDQDPFVLRHCAFNESNYFKKSDWACLRVDAREGSATHFTVGLLQLLP